MLISKKHQNNFNKMPVFDTDQLFITLQTTERHIVIWILECHALDTARALKPGIRKFPKEMCEFGAQGRGSRQPPMSQFCENNIRKYIRRRLLVSDYQLWRNALHVGQGGWLID
jgi:hypothetical protein